MISDIDTTLAIIGIFISLILGYLGLRYTLKFKKQSDIIFIKNNSISLFERAVKNLADLEIQFKGEKIKDNLIIFQGTFFNFGNTDIDNSIIHKPLEIEIPESYKWVQYKISSNSADLKIKIKEIDNKLVFEWDLLKEGEFFTFDSIVEYQSTNTEPKLEEVKKIEENLLDDIKFNHRIKDLKKIRIEKALPQVLSNYLFILLAALNIFFLLFMGNLASVPMLSSNYTILNELNLNSKPQYLNLSAKNKNEVLLKNLENDKIETLTITEARNIISKNIKIEKSKINYGLFIVYAILTLLSLILQIKFIILPEIRARRLNKKLKEYNYIFENNI